MKNYFLRLFKYNEWANNRVLEVILTDGFNEPSVLKLLSHIIAAQQLWMDRVLNKDTKLEVWPDYTLEGCITLSKESSANWIKFVEMIRDEDLSKTINYVTTKGDPFSNTIEDILTQLINHSSYHRAQIAMKCRQAGYTPAQTDFIVFARSGA